VLVGLIAWLTVGFLTCWVICGQTGLALCGGKCKAVADFLLVLYPTIPPRVEYTNTALGRSLAKAMGPLVRWAEENQPTVDLNRVEYEKRERKRANLPL
jgi:hypothetical protein